MMRAGWAIILSASVLFSGCLQGETSGTTLDTPPAEPHTYDDPMDMAFFGGGCNEPCVRDDVFRVAEGYSLPLEILLAWDGTASPGYTFNLTAPDGTVLTSQRGFDAARIVLRDAQPGDYVFTYAGSGPFTGSIAPFGPRQPGADDPLLPNLVTLVPEDIGFSGCSQTEQAEQGAERCLRLSNAVGNVGLGPLEVRLGLVDGVTTIAAGLGSFVQRLYLPGGTFEEAAVGGAAFHQTHLHWHYAGLATFELFEYDMETGLRGESVGQLKKSGFCFIDIGTMDDGGVDPAPQGEYGFEGCFVPDPLAWRMGVSVGWFDQYVASLDEQYVEVTGVPDGAYELVSTADGDNTLAESDDEDNSASVVIHLLGNEVHVVETRGFYAAPGE